VLSMMGEDTRRPILVVEDDPAIAELVTLRLRAGGYATRIAWNGLEALQHIPEFKPIAMILDISMPAMDGFQVLERLKAEGTLPGLPTMILTARNRPEDVRRAMECGARDYLTKPFDDRKLLARVSRLLRPVKK
jgi:DNA-binding response OmpR family regulator